MRCWSKRDSAHVGARHSVHGFRGVAILLARQIRTCRVPLRKLRLRRRLLLLPVVVISSRITCRVR